MVPQTRPQGPDAIQFENVSKQMPATSGNQDVLQNLSGTVPQGAVVTIVGPSGSGKSTLLSLCNLLTSADKGTIRVFGRPVEEWNVGELRRTVGLVFQSPTVLEGSVYDNLMASIRLNGGKLERPEEHLKRVGLPADLLARNAEDLSGGQKQRVAIARTLIHQPRILLLDEVTSALDVAAAREVEELLVQLQQDSDLTLVWVTHNLEQAQRVGTHTWLLVAGKLVEQQSTDAFFSSPREDVTQRFLAGTLSGGTNA